jgi:hypothetical membrane protein
MGTKALASKAIRNFIILPVAFIVSLNGTLVDIWLGIAVMEIIGPVLVMIWCLLVLKALTKGRLAYSKQ